MRCPCLCTFTGEGVWGTLPPLALGSFPEAPGPDQEALLSVLAIDRTYCCTPVPSYFPARVSPCACRVTEAGYWLSVFEAMSSPAEAAIRWADIVEDDLKTDIEPLDTEAGNSPAMEHHRQHHR